MGWGGVKNAALLVLAAGEFDAFITVDNLPYQQNIADLPIAVVLLSGIPTSFRFSCLSCLGWRKRLRPYSQRRSFRSGHNKAIEVSAEQLRCSVASSLRASAPPKCRRYAT